MQGDYIWVRHERPFMQCVFLFPVAKLVAVGSKTPVHAIKQFLSSRKTEAKHEA